MDDKIIPITSLPSGPYPEPGFPVEEAWKQMQPLLEAVPGQTTPGTSSWSWIKRFLPFGGAGLAAAAVIVFVVLFDKPSQHSVMKTYASNESPGKQLLPGGTLLYLDRHSRIREETTATRKAVLSVTGGVYIENLPSTKEQVLEIRTGTLMILPQEAGLYVSFDSSSQTTAVHVLAGNAVLTNPKDTFLLSAGESVLYDGKAQRFGNRQKANVNLSAYATRIFDFIDTPLEEVADCIEKAYDIKIVFADKGLAGCRITTRFEHKTLNEVLDIIGYTLQLDYSVDEKNKTVTLHGKQGD